VHFLHNKHNNGNNGNNGHGNGTRQISYASNNNAWCRQAGWQASLNRSRQSKQQPWAVPLKVLNEARHCSKKAGNPRPRSDAKQQYFFASKVPVSLE
jgi:hypothetical protein